MDASAVSRIAALSTSAPLMSTPESRAPSGGLGEWYRGAGGLRLRLAYWPCPGKARGTVFISPGRAEPIEKYYETIADLIKRDYAVVAHDWRGQGLSARLLPDRLKGHARSIEEYLDDYKSLLDNFEGRAPRPWIALGHSMGAALNLASLKRGETRIEAALMSSPMLRLRTDGHALWSVRLRTNWMVKQGQSNDYVPDIFDDPFEHTFANDALTHDEPRFLRWQEQLFACPHLAVGSPTWGWLDFALRIGDELMRDKGKALKKIRTPITIVCGTKDSLINTKAMKPFVRKLGNGRYVELPGAKHELLIEENDLRDQVFIAFDSLVELLGEEKQGQAVAALVPDEEPIAAANSDTALQAESEDIAAGASPSQDAAQKDAI